MELQVGTRFSIFHNSQVRASVLSKEKLQIKSATFHRKWPFLSSRSKQPAPLYLLRRLPKPLWWILAFIWQMLFNCQSYTKLHCSLWIRTKLRKFTFQEKSLRKTYLWLQTEESTFSSLQILHYLCFTVRPHRVYYLKSHKYAVVPAKGI